MIKSRSIDRENFIDIFLASANKVLEDNKLAMKLDKRDVSLVLARFDSLRKQNVFDFYSHNDPDPDKLIDWLARSGYLDANSCKKATALLSTLERTDFPPTAKGIHSFSLATIDNREDPDPAIIMAAEVADSSYAFWNSLYRNSNVAMRVAGEDEIMSIDWWSIALIAYDALGAMIGEAICGPPCAILFSATASIIYILGTT